MEQCASACGRERERGEQTDTLLVLKASGFQISLFLRLPLNQCGQECCSAPQYVSPFRTLAPSSTSSIHHSEATLFEHTIASVCFFFPSVHLPHSTRLCFLSLLSLCLFFSLHDLTFPIPPPLRFPLYFLQLEV